MIGAGIDAGALRAGLAACRGEPGPATPDAERAMWGVLRYVQQEPEDIREGADVQETAAEA
jgi:hypothetical protein